MRCTSWYGLFPDQILAENQTNPTKLDGLLFISSFPQRLAAAIFCHTQLRQIFQNRQAEADLILLKEYKPWKEQRDSQATVFCSSPPLDVISFNTTEDPRDVVSPQKMYKRLLPKLWMVCIIYWIHIYIYYIVYSDIISLLDGL